MHKKMLLCDTTLRDGEQMPGVVFSPEEKIKLAKKISLFGANFIEVMPAVSDTELEVAKELAAMGLKARITASTMIRKDHIDIAAGCGISHVTLFTPVSDIHLQYKLGITREENLEKTLEAIDYARSCGLKIAFAAEDAARADINYLLTFANTIKKYIKCFAPCDTLGCLTPFETFSLVQRLKRKCKCDIGLHIHNDFGLATANTLAGLSAGARLFSGTFCGIGERAGNAPIEEVCAALKYIYDIHLNVRYSSMATICRMVQRFSRVKLQPHKPVVGKNAFTHESGIHIDGVIKHSNTYEPFDPTEVGSESRFVFGKHNGSSIIRHLLGSGIDRSEVRYVLDRIKTISQEEKRPLSRSEVIRICSRGSGS